MPWPSVGQESLVHTLLVQGQESLTHSIVAKHRLGVSGTHSVVSAGPGTKPFHSGWIVWMFKMKS